MSADLSGQSTRRSPGLSLNLSSNNPFRKSIVSTDGASTISPPPPRSPFDDPPPRPTSTNPFLDPSNSTKATSGSMSSPKDTKSPTADELFGNLTIEDKSASKPPRPMNKPPGVPPRGENMPPPGRGSGPHHRPSRSQEEAMRARKAHQTNASAGGEKSLLDSSPKRPMDRRPRRNSESSVMDKDKPLTEEEKKQREMRRRERERRHRDKNGRPSKKLDLIDQLDATGIYGTGLFHHEGPFDALNPHRNRKGSRRAPMQAFPKDSLNMSIGGSGPLNARPDHSTFMGNHDDEAFRDFSTSGKDQMPYQPEMRKGEMPVFDPASRGSVVHGDESMGLGTSTFLEGTPATRNAIQRRDAEIAQETQELGLQRSKSLAQRIRRMNRGPREYSGHSRLPHPDGGSGSRSAEMPSGSSSAERNPFFNEFDKGEEQISVKRADSKPPRSPDSPPHRGLERRATTDASAMVSPEANSKPQGGGLLARVKSLKGGRRQRPEPPQAAPPAPAPGTAV